MLNRRYFIKSISAGALSLGVHHNLFAKQPSSMNVLFIAVDDLRPELGCYGNRLIKSPHIDKLASEGALFERAYCQQAVCAPSRASLHSGLRPDSTKVFDLQTPLRSKRPDVITLPQFFKKQGYKTVSLGKLYHHKGKDDPQGWSEREWAPGGDGNWKGRGYLTKEAQAQIDTGKRKGVGVGPAMEAADVGDDEYPDGKVALRAIENLKKFKKSGEKFFLAVGFVKPHLPFNAPKKYWDMYDPKKLYKSERDSWPKGVPDYARMNWGELKGYTDIQDKATRIKPDQAEQLINGYYACVSYTDALVGKVVAELDKLGLRDNTLIVLWGDHGWKLNDYGAWCKHTNFEIDTHVPMIFSVPGFKKGTKSEALVEFVDIYPTIVDACGFDVPAHCEGSSLVPLFKDPDKEWKEAAFSQYPRGNRMGYSIRSGKWRYTEWIDRKSGKILDRELYDHADSPLADENLAGRPEQAETVKKLSAILDKGKGWKKIKK